MVKTRIDTMFESLRAKKAKGFIAYITAGDPSLEDTYEYVLRLEDAGVDMVELGIPFSDPLADGRVNQESAGRALDAGTTLDGVLETVSRLRKRTAIPILFYCYVNLLYAPGLARILTRAARAGVDGMLILDVPHEEGNDIVPLLHKNNINNIVLITPTSPDARIRSIVKHASGFVYGVSRTGVTGVQQSLATDASELVTRARKFTDLPVALGFGIGTPEQAAVAAGQADAVVVGSAIVQRFHDAGRSRTKRKAAQTWVGDMVAAVKGVSYDG
jgi:tryptophan synthase alpha chain